MSISKKYGRTYHYPFSPGTSSDDRINTHYWESVSSFPCLIHTEKLDGENNCLSRHGVFARSHVAPTVSPWTQAIRQHWQLLKNDLGDYEIFGENLYAIHSIVYRAIEHHYYVFAVREHDTWLSWEETCFIAACFDLPTVPVIATTGPHTDKEEYEQLLLRWVKGAGAFDPADAISGVPCTMEGLVSRNSNTYTVNAFADNVFKYVRKGHVKTDEHWTRNWKRAPLKHERYVDPL